MPETEIAKQYYKKKNWIFIATVALTLFLLFIMTYSFAIPLRNSIGVLTENTILLITLYFYIVYLSYFIVVFGLRYYGEFVLERKFYVSDIKFVPWIKQLGLRECWISFIVLMVVQAFYFFMEQSLTWWWLYVAICWILFELILNTIFPVFIQPLFYQKKPLEDKALSQSFIDLAKALGINIKEVFIFSSQEAAKNSLVLTGIEPKRRLFLNESLLEYAKEEIEMMVALEITRNYYGQVWKAAIMRNLIILLVCFFTGLSFAPLAVSFGFRPMTDVSSITLLLGLLLFFIIILTPLKNTYLRRLEKQSDELALRLTESPDAFISAMIRFEKEYLNDSEPSRFIELMLYEHVPFAKRISLAQDYAHNLLLRGTRHKF